MKVVILAGGQGTRINEESYLKPKPLIEIGTKPIIWHIMKLYSHYGLNDFIICCGYKGHMLKEYFNNYSLHTTDITVDLKKNKTVILKTKTEPWKVTLIDTGQNTNTGERLKKIEKYIEGDFCLTYGDGLSNVNILDTIKFHKKNKKYATILAVKPPARFGALNIKKNMVRSFFEKPQGDGGRINGGFFVLSKKIFRYLNFDNPVWEKEPLENLAKDSQLCAYPHDKFWHAMDSIRDKQVLENLWLNNKAPWKVWKT
jgi:glucose-1-phosphate cytidylyltransferase